MALVHLTHTFIVIAQKVLLIILAEENPPPA